MNPNFFPAAADMRAMVKLINDLHAAPADPVVRRRLLLQRLCQMLTLHTGMSLLLPDRKRQIVVSMDKDAGCADASMGRVILPPEALIQYTADMARQTGAAFSIAHSAQSSGRTSRDLMARDDQPVILSAIPLCNFSEIAFLIFWPGRCRQTQLKRARQVVHLIHGELSWIYLDDFPAMDGQIPGLTPRQRSSLHCLLAGNSEKQIASKLGLSPHTVHVHIKAIYKQLRVSSRAELLSRFVPKYG